MSNVYLVAHRPRRGWRRSLAQGLRHLGAVLFWISGGPMLVGRWLMWAAGRAAGVAYRMECDR